MANSLDTLFFFLWQITTLHVRFHAIVIHQLSVCNSTYNKKKDTTVKVIRPTLLWYRKRIPSKRDLELKFKHGNTMQPLWWTSHRIFLCKHHGTYSATHHLFTPNPSISTQCITLHILFGNTLIYASNK